jgi:RNA polymerase sigma-70 factor (ECF subfamily)
MTQSADPWSRWLEKHGAALLLLARHWAASRADAEDIVQEAFVRYWRSRQRVQDAEAYLFACVRHCALDWQRERRRRQYRELVTARRDVEPLLIAPIERDERRMAIEEALRKLPVDQAEVLVLKIWGGLSFPQIGLALEISANTAASRYRYALAWLREQLMAESIL